MAMSFPGEEGRSKEPGLESDSLAQSRLGANRAPNRFEETGELDLGDEDVRLPWLEGDDEDEYEESGTSTAQLIGFVLLGIVALALIVGGIWWAQRGSSDEELVASGETIEAPDTPYKTRPEKPGGEVVAGTGDTSYAVAEGQTRQVRIGSETPAPAASAPAASPKADASATPGAAATPTPPPVTGPGVQVGAYSTRDSAEKGWTRLSQQYEALSGMKYRIVEGRADIGTVYRLQAVPGDAAAANSLCTTLKGAGLSCQVKR